VGLAAVGLLFQPSLDAEAANATHWQIDMQAIALHELGHGLMTPWHGGGAGESKVSARDHGQLVPDLNWQPLE
jgi:hypothetical protein